MTDLEKFQKLYAGATSRITQLEGQLNNAKQIIIMLEAEKKQWLIEKAIQQSIVQQALNTSNAASNAVLIENSLLKEEIRRLTDGNHG